MEIFLWHMTISFLMLFVIIGTAMFIYLREKSFKFYGLYCFFLLIYVFSGNDFNSFGLEKLLALYVGTIKSQTFFYIFDSYLQIIFYSIYSIFALYFLDLDKLNRSYFNKIIKIIKSGMLLFFLLGIVCYLLNNEALYTNLFMFMYLPLVMTIFILSISKSFQTAGKLKYIFLIGSSIFVGSALFAFAANVFSFLHVEYPIYFFYFGICAETLFFSLGLTYKVKLMNDEKNKINAQVLNSQHEQEIIKIHSLLEGEEREKKRMAEELHDGIVGDLTAIKYNIAYLNTTNQNEKNTEILQEVNQIIEKSCIQIREISHNLSPSSIINYGLVESVSEFCKKIQSTYDISCDFVFKGQEIDLDVNKQTHIYRIIQELVQNIVTHSEANFATVEINNYPPMLSIIVEDNGKGFSENKSLQGIGFNNIDSRIKILNGSIEKVEILKGSRFCIVIDTEKVVQD